MMPPVVEGEESMYPHHQNSGDSHVEGRSRRSSASDFMRRNKVWLIGGGLVLVIVFSVIIGVSVNKGGGSASSSAGSGSLGGGSSNGGGTTDENDPLTRKKADLQGRIKSTFAVLGVPESHAAMLDSFDSPQQRALNWVAASDNYDSYSDDRRLQRYALASFFYATYAVRNAYVTQQVPWTSAEKWLSDDDECEWEGVTCESSSGSDDRVVTKIELEEHRVSGTIPLDLVLLRESLTDLVLTNNLVFMEGESLEVFKYLENLQVLMMADNYLVERNGLPDSLKDLAHLKKLILSYNLLQGSLPTNYFYNMRKLTHLEVESNYLSGALPESLYKMKQLVYLYIRRNDLNFNFGHAMKEADWPNMFSMWVDHNNITGTIPTEVGKLTGLASFSLTNTTVHGIIPSEIGQLSGLRRLWLYGNNLKGAIPAELGNLPILEVVELYGNKLTGSMPTGVCAAVGGATYEYKVLSADCSSVQCQDCCTQCY